MSDLAQPIDEQITELLALADKATRGVVKIGNAGHFNIVDCDGDDIVPFAMSASEAKRDFIIAACNLAPALARLVQELQQRINTPELHNFADGVVSEAQHQRARWGSDHDAGKTAADWFWLIGYLAQKAMYAHISGDTDKALHHTISTAAALANWHAAISGESNAMRPGISEEKQNAV